jgi:hypothetical protein
VHYRGSDPAAAPMTAFILPASEMPTEHSVIAALLPVGFVLPFG